MNKALFLDRDGVLNRERGHYSAEVTDFEVLPEVCTALKIASENGYLLIVISNQGGVSKGILSPQRVEEHHQILTSTLAKEGVYLDEIYYCKHHDEIGKCICRKPNSLMFEKAIARFDIDTEKSIMIGDSQRDIDAAQKVGIKGHLITSNSSILNEVKSLA